MKKLLIIALGFCSSLVFADSTINSMRTSQGELVSIGDSESSLIQKMGKPRPSFYVLNDGQYYCAATQYTYRIDLQEYDVILCRGKVVKIQYRNL